MALGVPGPTGATGATGAAGTNGTNGIGVSAGGTTGQALVKLSATNYDTGWATITSGGGTWGSITGTLSSQTDLQNALNAKLSTSAAASTYQTQAGMSAFLSTASAVANYQTISGMSAYLTTSAAASTYLPLTGGTLDGDTTVYGTLSANNISILSQGITFQDSTFQETAFPPAGGTTSQYIRGDGSLYTFPPVGDRYLTSSTSTLTVDSGNGKTMTVGTGLSYSPQQDITVSYNTANHMHGTVLTYNSTTGVMTWDSNTHSGSGTYSSWEVNVGGVAGAILPVGGTAGQVLAKINSTNFNTEWISLGSMATQSTSAYLSTASAVANYLSISNASSTYLTQSSASNTYTTKANNLSDLTSSSTARTNLGLGSMAVETASSYLSTASASANFIGTSAYATTAQAQAGTSTTTVINPSTLLDAKYFQGGKYLTGIAWSTATSGVGASASGSGINGRLLTAPTTATGYANQYGSISNASRGNAYGYGFDFSKRFTFGFRLARNVASPDSNSVFRAKFGPINVTIGDISARGIEVKVSGSGALQLLVHNGTTLTTATSSYTPTNATAFDVVGISDGSGNATLYVNGSSVATSTGAATTTASGGQYIIHEVENTSTIPSGAMSMNVSDIFIQQNI
jgi:hypothetical protein